MAFYDVVVVGAGSAGCAVVNRLCHSSDRSVCLVEAGPDYGPRESGQWPPELLDCHLMPSTHDWGYSAQGADGSTWPEPRAKVIGGCSAHNQCGASWGQPADYDAWAQAGNTGWSYAELAPLIQQIERAPSEPPLPYRGHQGLIQTRPYRDEELASWHLCWLRIISVRSIRPLRAHFEVFRSLPLPQRKSKIAMYSSTHLQKG